MYCMCVGVRACDQEYIFYAYSCDCWHGCDHYLQAVPAGRKNGPALQVRPAALQLWANYCRQYSQQLQTGTTIKKDNDTRFFVSSIFNELHLVAQ
jgi:hypothetical protein